MIARPPVTGTQAADMQLASSDASSRQGTSWKRTQLGTCQGVAWDWSAREEKVLKNAKDSCAAEALEIATYTALARLARVAGDSETERLAQSIMAEEQKMLDRLLKEIPRLTDLVARAEFEGEDSYDLTDTAQPTPCARRGERPGARLARA